MSVSPQFFSTSRPAVAASSYSSTDTNEEELRLEHLPLEILRFIAELLPVKAQANFQRALFSQDDPLQYFRTLG